MCEYVRVRVVAWMHFRFAVSVLVLVVEMSLSDDKSNGRQRSERHSEPSCNAKSEIGIIVGNMFESDFVRFRFRCAELYDFLIRLSNTPVTCRSLYVLACCDK